MEKTDKVGVTRVLASYAKNIEYDQLPVEAVQHLKICILDSIGCGLFGSTLPWGKIIIEFAKKMNGKRETVLWGTPFKSSLQNAVLANGTLVHSFEIDDLHKNSIVHLGSVTLAPSLGLAEVINGVDGKAFLTALAAGYEVGARIGNGSGLSNFHRGFHPTGTIGT